MAGNAWNYGSGWSSRRPIPTVGGYLSEYPELSHSQSQHDAGPSTPSALPRTSSAASGSESPQLPSRDDSKQQQQRPSDPPGSSGSNARFWDGSDANQDPDRAASEDISPDKLPRQDAPGAADKAPANDAEAQARQKEHFMQAAGPSEKPASFQARGARVVTDPITHADVVITDASPHAVVDPKMLSSLYGVGFSTTALPRRKLKKHDELYTSVYPAQPSNALLYPFPPNVDPNIGHTAKATRSLFGHLVKACTVALTIIWLLTVVPEARPTSHTSYARTWFRFSYRTLALVALAYALRFILLYAADKIEADLDQVRARMYQARGTRYPPPVPESAEWLNNFLSTLWRQLDPQQFLPIADSVEESIKPFLPPFVARVKLDDLGFGTRPPQIVSMRGLADLMTDPKYPRETWLNIGSTHLGRSASPGSNRDNRAGRNHRSSSQHDSRTARSSTSQVSAGNNLARKLSSGRADSHESSTMVDTSLATKRGPSVDDVPTPHPPTSPAKQSNSQFDEKENSQQEKHAPAHDRDDSEASETDDSNVSDEEEESGDFLNYEIALAYDGLNRGQWTDVSAGMYTGASGSIHLAINILLSLLGRAISIPIYTSVEQLTLTLRVRAQLISEPPYMRNVMVALLGTPRVSFSVRPFSSWLPNLVDLPFVHRFVQTALAAACQPYIVPRFITLNLADMLAGEGVRKETDAVGIVAVQIVAAEGLSSQDANGYSDPYIIVSLAKFGRPLYSTRIIFKDLNPVWNETAFVLITKDDIMAEEKISLQLWDSDMHTADDIVGRAAKNVNDLMETPNRFLEFTEGLMGFEDADSMAGNLTYRIGFFELAQFTPQQRQQAVQIKVREAQAAAKKRGRKEGKSHDEIRKNKIEVEQAVHKQAKDEEEKNRQSLLHSYHSGARAMADHAAVEARAPEAARKNTDIFNDRTLETGLDAANSPPDPNWPSGVLRIGVENIEGLELRGNMRDGMGGEERLPSSYCEVIVGGEVVHTTRVRQYTNMPFFDTAIEILVRDWRHCSVIVCVRDAVVRAHDPIIGIVHLSIPELLTKSSRLSRRFPIEHGAGVGKVSLNLLFRSVQLQLPRVLLGAPTATIELLSPITVDLFPTNQKDTELGMRGRRKARHLAHKAAYVSIGRKTKRLDKSWIKFQAAPEDENNESEDDLDDMTFTTNGQTQADSEAGISATGTNATPIRFGVYDRFSTSLGFMFGGPGGLGAAGGPVAAVGDRLTSRRSDALAVAWMADLEDDVETWVELPLVIGRSLEVLSRNYMPPATLSSLDDGQYYNSERDKKIPSAVHVDITTLPEDQESDQEPQLPSHMGPELTGKHHEFVRIGTLRAKIIVRAGLSDAHAATLKSDVDVGQNAKHAYEVFAHLNPDAVRRRNWRLDLGLPELPINLPGLPFGDKGDDGQSRKGSLLSSPGTRHRRHSSSTSGPPPSTSPRWGRTSLSSLTRRAKYDQGQGTGSALGTTADSNAQRTRPEEEAEASPHGQPSFQRVLSDEPQDFEGGEGGMPTSQESACGAADGGAAHGQSPNNQLNQSTLPKGQADNKSTGSRKSLTNSLRSHIKRLRPGGDRRNVISDA